MQGFQSAILNFFQKEPGWPCPISTGPKKAQIGLQKLLSFWVLRVPSKPGWQNKKWSIILGFNFVKYQCAKNCIPMQTAMCTLMYFVQYEFIVKTVGPLK
jgi:hypothetical protein